MKIFISFIIITVTMMFLISSCETEAKNVKIPEYEPKLVISSFISPSDKVSEISVRITQRIFGDITDDEEPGNIQAFISDQSKEISASRTENGFMFRTNDMNIESGKTYTLTVLSDKAPVVKASCTIPAERNFNIEVDTSTKMVYYQGTEGFPMLNAEISITDFPGEENYFRLFCVQEIYGIPYWNPRMSFRLTDVSDNIFTDQGKQGEKIFLRSVGIQEYPEQDSSFLKVYIFNTDKDYYEFHRSFQNYSGGEDPFSENSRVYSNVDGGLGIFAGYTIDSLIFRLK